MTESEYLVLAEAVLNDIEIRLEHIADSSDVDIVGSFLGFDVNGFSTVACAI